MNDPHAVTATFAEVESLKALWELQQEGKAAAHLSEIRDRVCARRRKLGLPEPALTTISTTLRNGAAKGVFKEMMLHSGGELVPLVRTGVRSSLGASRTVQKVAYAAAITPQDTLPHMLRELASLYPASERAAAVLEFARSLGFADDVVKKLDALLKKA